MDPQLEPRHIQQFVDPRAIQLRIGNILGRGDRPDVGRATIYRGTADPERVRRQRKANKVARRQRVQNARRNKR